LAQDPNARVACETAVTTGVVMVMGEITTKCYVDIEQIVRKTVKEIGYDRAKFGFDSETCAVLVTVKGQSPDIALGVDNALESRTTAEHETGAGDQGMMFGYADNETAALMPMPIYLAHKLTKKLTELRKNDVLPYLRPDGKAQVTVLYDNGKPVEVTAVVVSTQHAPEIEHNQIERDVIEQIIKSVIPAELLTEKTKYYVNPTGRFVIGGPQGDCGLTGRKIIVDTYGGYVSHGGGCFSGKDPTKVDRSAAYMARYAAKNVIAAGLADKCEVILAYAIGVAHPVSITVNTHGTGKLPDDQIISIVEKVFDFRPSAIIENLNLRRPIYKQTAAYGHFGRADLDLPWENTDKVDELMKAAEAHK